MAYSSVLLCNMALLRVGGARISSLSEDTENAIIANLVYQHTYDSVLSSYPWNCSTQRVKLAQLTSIPAFGYSYQYQLPSDPYCLRVFETYPKNAEYRIEDRKLLTDEDEIYIRYSGRIDEAGLDSWVADVIIAKLALQFVNRISQDIQMKNILNQEYMITFQHARMIDGANSKGDETGEDDWINAGWGVSDDEEDTEDD